MSGAPPTRTDLIVVERDILRRLSAAIREGREHWIPILRELRDMRTRRTLLPEGTPVASLRNG